MILAITGGTGSLGQALLREQEMLIAHDISKIRIISRDPHKQEKLERDYQGEIPLDQWLGDVTNKGRVTFALRDVDYIIHAAALKSVPKVELDVPTGIHVNTVGVLHTAFAFLKSPQAKSFILASTDKACHPVTAYGTQKLAAEKGVTWFNTFQKKVSYGVARYGNVFGSQGSVVPYWTELARQKRRLPITDARMSRFFIPLAQAAPFVLQALFEGEKVYAPRSLKAPTWFDSPKSFGSTTTAPIKWNTAAIVSAFAKTKNCMKRWSKMGPTV